jgi:hypothetical protein
MESLKSFESFDSFDISVLSSVLANIGVDGVEDRCRGGREALELGSQYLTGGVEIEDALTAGTLTGDEKSSARFTSIIIFSLWQESLGAFEIFLGFLWRVL